VYQGHIMRVVVASFESPDGVTFDRDVVHTPGAVAIVPLRFDVEGNPMVVLVEQFRPALGVELREIPAGLRDVTGEDPRTTAERELAEECGLSAGRLELLTSFQNAAGMTDAATIVYLALDLEQVDPHRDGPEEDHMTVHVVPLADALADVASGRLTDAKTVIGLLLAERWLERADREPA
jgi:ADP-ribose pyrophosphatase